MQKQAATCWILVLKFEWDGLNLVLPALVIDLLQLAGRKGKETKQVEEEAYKLRLSS